MCNATLTIVRSVLHVVQRYLSNCQKRIARCAKAPIQLSEAHCTLCKGTYPIVRSTLHVVQRYLDNCQKPVANCDRCLHYAVNQEIKCGCDRKSVDLRSKFMGVIYLTAQCGPLVLSHWHIYSSIKECSLFDEPMGQLLKANSQWQSFLCHNVYKNQIY